MCIYFNIDFKCKSNMYRPFHAWDINSWKSIIINKLVMIYGTYTARMWLCRLHVVKLKEGDHFLYLPFKYMYMYVQQLIQKKYIHHSYFTKGCCLTLRVMTAPSPSITSFLLTRALLDRTHVLVCRVYVPLLCYLRH